jgi:hypothetical protein
LLAGSRSNAFRSKMSNSFTEQSDEVS